MKVRKSIFSYTISAVFALFCGFSIFCVLEEAGFTQMFGWPISVLIGAVCIYLVLTAAVFKALCTLFAEIGKCGKKKERRQAVLAVLLPVLVMLGIVVYLVWYLLYHIPIVLHDDTYYRMALVTAENSGSYAPYDVSGLYVLLLHGMLLLFGNTPFAGVVLQIILFFICLLLLYIGMQSYAGVVPAAVAMAAFGFFPVSIEYVFSLTPDFFYMTLYLFGFYLTGILYRKFCRSGIGSPGQYLLLFFTGLYAGFLIYLDIYGISLYFFFAAWYSADREKNKQAFKANAAALLGGIGGFFLTAAVFTLLAGSLTDAGSFAANYGIFLKQPAAYYLERGALTGNHVFMAFPAYNAVLSVIFILFISLAFFTVPAVFLKGRSPDIAFILNLFFLYGLSYWGMTGLRGQMNEILCWCMLAGLGIYGAIRISEKLSPEKASVADTAAIEMKEADEEKMSDPKKAEEAGKPEQKEIEEAEMSDRKETQEVKTTDTTAKKQEQEKPAPGKPLHNPLPVPEKKHRPQADFAHPVADAEMKFDIEVADGDDFDV